MCKQFNLVIIIMMMACSVKQFFISIYLFNLHFFFLHLFSGSKVNTLTGDTEQHSVPPPTQRPQRLQVTSD